MPRVNERLRYAWRMQRAQMLEERTVDQNMRARSVEDIAIVDHEVRVVDALLALPLGTKFDAQEIRKPLDEEAWRARITPTAKGR